MINLQFQYNQVYGFLSEEDIQFMQDEVDINHSLLVEKAGKGNEYLGWIDLPVKTEDSLLDEMEADARSLREKAEIIVVIGTGGSLLGARAVIGALETLFSSFYATKNNPAIVFAGHNISQDYHAQLLSLLDRKDYAVIVVSKSGTTTEPAIAFRLIKNHIEKKYDPAEAASRIIAITGTKGSLKSLAEKNGYKTYTIPDDVNGRFSVLSPAGLFPIAAAGFDIRSLLEGAVEMRKVCIETSSLTDNPAASYAAIRSSLYRMGNQIEILIAYEPQLHHFTEWWKQLFAESEGKAQEGLFPAGGNFTCDLHSLGQYILEGQRILFETVVHVSKTSNSLIIPLDEADSDGLNYLAGKTLHDINSMAALVTSLAHTDSDVPNMDVIIPAIDERSLGELIYFFEFSCALSGYLMGINPFNQPGVDAYKNNLFAMLGKPGFENETELIRARMSDI